MTFKTIDKWSNQIKKNIEPLHFQLTSANIHFKELTNPRVPNWIQSNQLSNSKKKK